MQQDKSFPIKFIPKQNYLSADFLLREKSKLWPRAWQVACRLQELPNVGSFVTYEVADESIIVVRTASGIKSYHNVCPHRGRQLTEGCGHTNNFRCSYHGWTFNLDGDSIAVQDRQDFSGCLKDEDIRLQEVKADTWGGFVFINMASDCEPLADYLKPVPEYLDPFELEAMSFRWYVTAVMPANWKVALEAFMEGYHVAATHPQLLQFQGDDYTQSVAHGKHSHFGYWQMSAPLGQTSPRLKVAPSADPRDGVVSFFRIMEEQLAAIFTDRDFEAAKKLHQAVPAEVDPFTAFGAAVELGRAAAIADGAGYPTGLDYEKLARAGADWHIFPNCVVLPWFDGALWYRARPHGDDPDTCIFDIWSLKRYAPGKEPAIDRRVVNVMGGESIGVILDQDVSNMVKVQKGMKSRGFSVARPNPVQEVEVTNFHEQLEAILRAP